MQIRSSMTSAIVLAALAGGASALRPPVRGAAHPR